MALPPSSMMRARLRANSSISAEPPLTGSDGALTVTPQFAVLAWARHGLKGLRWTLLVTAARRIMGLRRAKPAAAGAARQRRQRAQLNPCFGHIGVLKLARAIA